MRRLAVLGAALLIALGAAQDAFPASARVAALQIALRAHGFDLGPVDGLRGPATTAALLRFQRARGLPPDGRLGPQTRRALGRLGGPPLGRRELGVGTIGWDVAVLEFRLLPYGLPPRALDGRFAVATSAALRRFQSRKGLVPDGIAGAQTYRALRGQPPAWLHTVSAGESFFSIAARYRVSPWQLARVNRLTLTAVIVPGQRLLLPAGARATSTRPPETHRSVVASINRWSRAYGVDPELARALAWMESGFQQDVVSSVGAVGVMQLLPETWEFVDTVLLGVRTPRTAEGNVRAGVRYLRWQLDQFDGNTRSALAGWYQGARAVREHGVFPETKEFVRIVLALYRTV